MRKRIALQILKTREKTYKLNHKTKRLTQWRHKCTSSIQLKYTYKMDENWWSNNFLLDFI